MMNYPETISPVDLKAKVRSFSRNSDESLCFVFGAGASAGYTTDHDFDTPPVVANLLDTDIELVDRALNRHPFIKGQRNHIVRELKNFENDLELYLSDVYMGDADDDLFSSLLFYLQDLFTQASQQIDFENNNYKNLFNLVRERRGKKSWSLLTFNYDTILEQSIQAAGRGIAQRNFERSADYWNVNPFVIKMHGGINFRYRQEQGKDDPVLSAHDVFMRMMNDARATKEYWRIGKLTGAAPDFFQESVKLDEKTNNFIDFQQYVFPLMMIPIHGAIQPENSFFKSTLRKAKSELEKSGLIIAVGYNFGDEFFAEVIKKADTTKKELILVSRKTLSLDPMSHRGYQNIAKVWNGKIFISDTDGFGEFVEALY